jgi:DNA-binding NarL/FixJ family response regulator
MSIRILLADDHQMMRQGLKSLLAEQPDFEVVGEAGDGRTAVRLAQELSAAVVIMDVTMPDLNGVDATRQLKSEAPDVKVVGLSMHPERQFVLEMLSVGASGYLLKDCPFTELVQAIRAAVEGDVYLSPKVAGVVVRGRGASNGAARSLTPREREVLQQVAEGRNTKQVAQSLHISTKTVETHRRQIMEKLELFSVAELARYAIREGLTPLNC